MKSTSSKDRPRETRLAIRFVHLVARVVPSRLRTDWIREWEAEIAHMNRRLEGWKGLDRRERMAIVRRTLGAVVDAAWLQPRRLEDEIAQDVRFGLRTLRREKSFAIVGIVALSLGIGAAVTVFSVVEAALLRPLPFADESRLVAIAERFDTHHAQITPANFIDWRGQQQSFTHIAAYARREMNIVGAASEPRRVNGAIVSADMFETLGVEPVLGRGFRSDEESPAHRSVVVIGTDVWQRDFAGDPHVIGRHVDIEGEPYDVIGVMPSTMRFPIDTDVWLPPKAIVPELDKAFGDPTQIRGLGYLGAVARLAPGATIESAQTEMTGITARLRERYPDSNRHRFDDVISLRQSLVGDVRPALLILSGAVGLVLLIVCANVANLLLARSSARQRELAIRTAIGSSRARAIRQMLTESVLLAAIGGIGGCVLAALAIRLIVSRAIDVFPPGVSVGINVEIVTFALLLSGLTGIVFGVVPALRATRPYVGELLRESTRGATMIGRRMRLHGALVVLQVGLSVVLLAGAGLLIKSFVSLGRVPLGFEPHSVLTARLAPSGPAYADDDQRTAYVDRVIASVAAVGPAVVGVGAIDTLPLVPGNVRGYTTDAHPDVPADQLSATNRRIVTPGYFRALQIPVLAGRDLDARDRDGAPLIAVVNETFAREAFGEASPVGRRLSFGASPAGDRVWIEIVGLVGDVHNDGASIDPKAEVYIPLGQMAAPGMSLVVRTTDDPATLSEALRAAAMSADPTQPLSGVLTFDEIVSRSFAQPSFYALLFGVFAALSIALAAAGVYGVTAYSVSQRTHEIGIRMALGATSRRVLTMVVRRGATLMMVGIGAGLFAAVLLSKVIASLLFRVSPADPPTLAIAAAILGLVALLACYLPARRATRIDPLEALRTD